MDAAAQEQAKRLDGQQAGEPGVLGETPEIDFVAQDAVEFAARVARCQQRRDEGTGRRSGDAVPAIALLFRDTQRANVSDAAHSSAFQNDIGQHCWTCTLRLR